MTNLKVGRTTYRIVKMDLDTYALAARRGGGKWTNVRYFDTKDDAKKWVAKRQDLFGL